jgi:enoyl-[acyl-carrier protein] reductase I
MPSRSADGRKQAAVSRHKPDWKANDQLAVGKGATVQEFVAVVGDTRLVIDVAPWGEGHLFVNGREIAHVTDAADRRQAFRRLNDIADRLLRDVLYEQRP